MQKKTILFFLKNLQKTGSETLIHAYIQELNRSGHFKITICLLERGGALVSELDPNIHVHYLIQDFSFIDKVKHHLGIPVLSTRLSAILAKTNPDICYFNTISTIFLLSYLQKKSFKIAVHIHELLCNFEDIKGTDVQHVLTHSDAIIASSSLVKNIFEPIYSNPIFVINATIKPLPRVQKKQNEHLVTIISSGSVCYQKGADLFVEIAKICQDFKFIWLGTTTETGFSEIIKQQASQMDNITFITCKDQDAYISNFSKGDIFVSTSRGESMGLVMQEAISMGIPVIATNSRGSKLIVHAKNGLIVDSFEPQRMADEIIKRANNLNPIETKLAFEFEEEFNNLEKILSDL